MLRYTSKQPSLIICKAGMERVHAEVMPVGNNAREPLPMLVHNGKKYVISEPGREWGLRVVIENAKQDQRYRVSQPQQQHCWATAPADLAAANNCWMLCLTHDCQSLRRLRVF